MHKSFGAILLLFLISTQASAQAWFGAAKCDSFQVTVDSTQAILYRKGKTGVYDLKTESYLIKPTKNCIIFVEAASSYISFDKSGVAFSHFSEGDRTFYHHQAASSRFYIHFPAIRSADYEQIADFNGTVLNYTNGDRVQTNPDFMADFFPETCLEFNPLAAQNWVVNYRRIPLDPLINREYYNEVDSGLAKSGVYDAALNVWDIPPIYAHCEARDSFVFCLISTPEMIPATNESPLEVRHKFAYDVYVQHAGKYVLKLGNLRAISEENMALLFDFDWVEMAPDKTHFISHKNGKSGFWQLELFRKSDPYKPVVELVCTEVLPTQYDFIKFDNEKGFIFTVQKNASHGLGLHILKSTPNGVNQISKSVFATERIFYGRNTDQWTKIYVDNDQIAFDAFLTDSVLTFTKKSTIRKIYPELEMTRGCGLQLMNDSLVYCLNFMLDSISPFIEPLKSMVYPDEDSLVFGWEEGVYLVVYPVGPPGYNHSGVYNMEKNNWFINPTYQIITHQADHFLMKQLLDSATGWSLEYPIYTLKSTADSTFFEAVPMNQNQTNWPNYEPFLLHDPNLKAKHPFPQRSIYTTDHSIGQNMDYYVQNQTGLWQVYGLIPNDSELSNAPLSEPKELVHYCRDYDYFVYLERDSLFIELPDEKRFAVQAEGGKIQLRVQFYGGLMAYKVYMVEKGKEQIYFSAGYDSSVYIAKYDQLALYYQSDNHFIINENFNYDNLNQYYLDMDYFWGEELAGLYQHFQTETSVIWEKTYGLWEIKTPYYAEIIENPLGYLVRTGSHEVLDKTTGNVEVMAPSRTLLLDKNYKAMPFLDFFDFNDGWVYDFGVSLCTETGCFLVANNGKVITNAEWDDFEWENGRIKAIRYKEFDPDIFWEEDPDDIIDAIEYFDLPTN